MKRAADLFSEQDKVSIEAAVRTAEEQTSVEIVPVVATVSDRYDRAEDLFGLILALLALTGAWLAVQAFSPASGWGPGEPPVLRLLSILVIVAVGFTVGAILATWLPILRLPFISRAEKRSAVERAAGEAFYRFRVRGTGRGTGILIYISLYERMVRVLGDDAIAAKLKQEDWDEVRDKVIADLKDKRPGEGLANAIVCCKDLCAPHFPVQPRRSDRLSNELRTID